MSCLTASQGRPSAFDPKRSESELITRTVIPIWAPERGARSSTSEQGARP